MAISTKWYGVGIQKLVDGTRTWDWDTDTIKLALCSSSYTPNQDTHATFSDITNELAATGGYTSGGNTLASCSVSYDAASNEVRLTSSATSWSSATFTCRYGIIYKSTGVAGTSPLLGYIDFGADETVASGTFTLTPDSTHGWLTITPA